MAAVGLSANAASSQAGFGRDYVRDLLRGKIKDPGASKLNRLAVVLDTTPEYLSGTSDVPTESELQMLMRYSPSGNINTLPVTHVLRPGFFDSAFELPDPSPFPVANILLDLPSQWLELVLQDRPELAIPDLTLLHMTKHEGRFDAGDLLVCEIYRDQGRLVSRNPIRVSSAPGDGVILEPKLPPAGGELDHALTMLTHDEFVSGENRFGIIPVGVVACEYRMHWKELRNALRGIARIIR